MLWLTEAKGAKEKSPAEEEFRKAASQQSPLQQALFLGVTIAAIAFVTLGMNRQDTQEVSFQWFKANLLASGLVEKLEVLNKSVVRVYVRPNTSGRQGRLTHSRLVVPGPLSCVSSKQQNQNLDTATLLAHARGWQHGGLGQQIFFFHLPLLQLQSC